MKKVINCIIALTVLLTLTACSNPTNSPNVNNNVTDNNSNVEEKWTVYKALSGTEWAWVETFINGDEEMGFRNIKFNQNDIYIDRVSYVINPETNLFLENDTEIDALIQEGLLFRNEYFYLKINGVFYSFRFSKNKDWEMYVCTEGKSGSRSQSRFSLKKGSGQNEGSEEINNVKGTYCYKGNKNNSGSIVLKEDGTWSYSGEKTDVSIKNGTYTVNGNKILMKWYVDAINDYVSEEFIVTEQDNGDVVWEGAPAGLLSTLFGIIDSSITFEKK